jgi:hypothetical protein
MKPSANRKMALAASCFTSVAIFIWLNTWHVWSCWDCMIERGRPFHYMITSSFATPGRYLWLGVLGDCVVVTLTAIGLYLLSLFVLKRVCRNSF